MPRELFWPPKWRVAVYEVDIEGICGPARAEHCGPAEDEWAIRDGARCLNRTGEWELEPPLMARDADFFKRCRFTLEQAAVVVCVTNWRFREQAEAQCAPK